jgi:glycosyltransferase involved in cell wall biosynthesis
MSVSKAVDLRSGNGSYDLGRRGLTVAEQTSVQAFSVTAENTSEQAEIEISVVVPFYNSEPYIDECAQALLAQKYPSASYEIIMVDNNSTDGSAAIIRTHPRIKLLAERKQGAYAARNRGVAAAQGKIIAFTDPDCVPASNWLAQIASAMKDPDTGILVGRHQPSARSLFLRMLEDYENEKNNYIFNSTIKDIYYGYTNNMAVRRALLDEIGPFKEMARGSDVILVRRCVDRYSCSVVRYCPNIRVRHLEIDSPEKYFRKQFVYGGSIQRYARVANARPITNRERILVFRKTVDNHQYSWPRSALLMGLLFIGFLYWVSGNITGALNSKRQVISGPA